MLTGLPIAMIFQRYNHFSGIQLVNVQRVLELEKSSFCSHHSTDYFKQESSKDAKSRGKSDQVSSKLTRSSKQGKSENLSQPRRT